VFIDGEIVIGFTASRQSQRCGVENYIELVNHVVKGLFPGGFVTGGCWGGDEYIAKAIRRYHPHIPHTVVVPGSLRQVSQDAIRTATQIIWMPPGSSYWQRNDKIVEFSTRMIAFWTGEREHSGTFMTINIARRAGKHVGIYNI
jgi:hypothetical protein